MKVYSIDVDTEADSERFIVFRATKAEAKAESKKLRDERKPHTVRVHSLNKINASRLATLLNDGITADAVTVVYKYTGKRKDGVSWGKEPEESAISGLTPGGSCRERRVIPAANTDGEE